MRLTQSLLWVEAEKSGKMQINEPRPGNHGLTAKAFTTEPPLCTKNAPLPEQLYTRNFSVYMKQDPLDYTLLHAFDEAYQNIHCWRMLIYYFIKHSIIHCNNKEENCSGQINKQVVRVVPTCSLKECHALALKNLFYETNERY